MTEKEKRKEQMKNNLFKILILAVTLMIGQNVYADVEEEVVVVTNVPYEASVEKKSSTESVTMDAITGSHTGLSTVFTLQTNGGDEHFDYVIKSYIDIDGDRVQAYGDDGRLIFAHVTVPPTLSAYNNAKSGVIPSKNVFAYPTRVNMSGGLQAEFRTNYKDYGNCYVISMPDVHAANITHMVLGSPSANTYEPGYDEAGNYKATIEFTIVSK